MPDQPDPRVLALAKSRYRDEYGALGAVAWDKLDPEYRQSLINVATKWLRAAVESGVAPLADRPSDKHDAVWLDEQGFLWSEYQTVPSSHGDAILRLVWASEVCSSKRELEVEHGAEFRLIGWSQ
jgi:hypothetical protein